jgi:uncharacterized protein YecE (DUF72 family)
MRLRTGTSGFSYKAWCGSFYPEKIAPAKMLAFYSEKLPAVEINNTFYRMPKPELLAGWKSQVPEDFRFVLKASQRITHRSRLKESGDDSVQYLLRVSAALGEKRGPFLIQLPPNMKCDLERLQRFLQVWPRSAPAAFEFRHPSWFEGAALDDLLEILHEGDHSLCIAQSGGEADAPQRACASWGYLRLRREDYDDAALAGWAEWVAAQVWKGAYVFFKHEDEGAGPRLASRFADLFSQLDG